MGPQRPPELVLLTVQIHHLTAFNCDLLTSCWLVFSSQWPIAISLVITLLKSSRELDNARELYMSPVSSAAKNRTSPLNKISACLQWGATVGSQGGGGVCACVCMPTCLYLWLEMQSLWCVYRDYVVYGCVNLLDRAQGLEIHLTAPTFRCACVWWYEPHIRLQVQWQMHNRQHVVCHQAKTIIVLLIHTHSAYMSV